MKKLFLPRIPVGKYVLIELIDNGIRFGIVRAIGTCVDKCFISASAKLNKHNSRGFKLGDIVAMTESEHFEEYTDSDDEEAPTYCLYPVDAIMGIVPSNKYLT